MEKKFKKKKNRILIKHLLSKIIHNYFKILTSFDSF